MYLALGVIIAHLIPTIWLCIFEDGTSDNKLTRWGAAHWKVTAWFCRICLSIGCVFMAIGGIEWTGHWSGILCPALYLGVLFLIRWIWKANHVQKAKRRMTTMLHPNYPNMELLEYKTRQLLNQNNSFKEAVKKAKEEKGSFAYISFEANMFPQVWPNTCMGFDVKSNGSPAIGGQAITVAYTTVFRETLTDTYVVCFGDRPCYMVEDATDDFHEDLRNHNMVPLSQAASRY